MEDRGIAAVVLPSLFEEQLTLESEGIDSDLSRGDGSSAESLTYLPDLRDYNFGPDGYLGPDRRAKQAVCDSRDRQPERQFRRAAGFVMPARSSKPAPTPWN